MINEVNSQSDSKFCKEMIAKLGKQENTTTLITDGAYGSIENVEHSAENNINLITTALIDKAPDIIQSGFVLNETTHEVVKCPLGKTSYKSRYYQKT